MKPGTRVFAVISANSEEVRFLGFGTYVGDLPRPGTPERFSESDYEMVEQVIREHDDTPPLDSEAIIRWEIEKGHTAEEDFDKRMDEVEEKLRQDRAQPVRERAHELLLRMANNPKIELDNGDVVWGYQCWWGPEEQWAKVAQGRTITEVRIADELP